MIDTVKEVFQNDILQEVIDSNFNKQQLQELTENLSRYELRIQELEHDFEIKESNINYGQDIEIHYDSEISGE